MIDDDVSEDALFESLFSDRSRVIRIVNGDGQREHVEMAAATAKLKDNFGGRFYLRMNQAPKRQRKPS